MTKCNTVVQTMIKKRSNRYKILLKSFEFFLRDKISVVKRIRETEILFDV